MSNFFVSLFCFLLFTSTAQAEDPGFGKAGFSTQESRIAFRGIGEAWQEPSFGSVYRSDRFYGFLGMSHRFHYHYAAYLEGGFVRADGNSDQTAIQLIPVTLGASVLFPNGKNVEPFVGLGFSVVNFLEQIPNNSISGTKLGMDFRTGIRIATRFLNRMNHPKSVYNENYTPPPGPKQLDIEVMFGQRFHQLFGVGEGFNLSAFRIGVGMQLRL